MRKPVIGLTTYPAGEEHGWHTPVAYVEAVIRAGGVPVLLPSQCKDGAKEWVEAVDGVVVIGGGDINPHAYGAEHHESIYCLSPDRDDAEFRLMRILLNGRTPTLAICRGLQVLNTVAGGTLHVHLPEVVGEQVLHRTEDRKPIPHGVRIAEDSHLASLLGTQVKTASWHHQAIDRLGFQVHAVAWAEDGVIEAVEVAGCPHIVAVQWHPEMTADTDTTQQRLFDWLVQEAHELMHE